MRIVGILGPLDPGGAQLSALRLSAALRRHGAPTTQLAGDAPAPGLKLAARYGLPRTPTECGTARCGPACSGRPRPYLPAGSPPGFAGADLVHAHMAGAWWAAARAMSSDVPPVARGHNEMCWPGQDHTPQARARPLGAGRLSAEPLPGLPLPRLTFPVRFRAGKAPEVLVAARALLAAPPSAYVAV